MSKKQQNLRCTTFYGALWGIFECTVGALIHQLDLSIGFLIWTPAALFFLNRVHQKTGSLRAVLFTSVFTALIKLSNLMLPIRLDRVINPAMSILLEGLAYMGVCALWEKRFDAARWTAARALAFSTLWRAAYMAYLVFLPDVYRSVSVISSPDKLVSFLVYENLGAFAVMAAGIGLVGLYTRRHQTQKSSWTPNLAVLTGLVCLGVLLQVTL